MFRFVTFCELTSQIHPHYGCSNGTSTKLLTLRFATADVADLVNQANENDKILDSGTSQVPCFFRRAGQCAAQSYAGQESEVLYLVSSTARAQRSGLSTRCMLSEMWKCCFADLYPDSCGARAC